MNQSAKTTGSDWPNLVGELRATQERLQLGGGKAAIERQHAKGRLTARERIAKLDRSRYAAGGAGPVGRLRDVCRLGRRAGGGRRDGDRHDRRPAAHDRGQRRHGESRRVLSDDGQEGAAGAADRVRQSAAAGLSGRFGRHLPAAAGRRVSRRGRFRPHLSQQRGALGGRHSAVRGHHGQLRRRRRLFARAVRQAADDRRLGAVSGRAGPREERDRPGSLARRAGRRGDARRRSAARSTITRRTTTLASSGCGG